MGYKDVNDSPAACVIGKRYVIKRLREEGILEPNCKDLNKAIAELKFKLSDKKMPTENINSLIEEVFNIGVKSGFKRALLRIQDGSIRVRKLPNEEWWSTSTNSISYNFTVKIPNVESESAKIKTTIKLSEYI